VVPGAGLAGGLLLCRRGGGCRLRQAVCHQHCPDSLQPQESSGTAAAEGDFS